VSDGDLIAAAKLMKAQHDVRGRQRSDQWGSEILSVSRDTVRRSRNARPWSYFLQFSVTDDE
jgi:hypothetical protein